mmetsp:Transcript_2355/g.4100  ORF Transcript_2355/g.4100 Transcript_2355/m.4100 type:complete len:94 (+) Transcript_2355:783-1064(+)
MTTVLALRGGGTAARGDPCPQLQQRGPLVVVPHHPRHHHDTAAADSFARLITLTATAQSRWVIDYKVGGLSKVDNNMAAFSFATSLKDWCIIQ